MKIFLIRHGESIQNTKENYEIGLPDCKVYLTEKGKEQAIKVGQFLKEYVVSNDIDLNNAIMWVSPYERTRQTAKLINEYLDVKEVKEDIALIEQMYGLFSDKPLDLIKKMYQKEFAYYDNYYKNGSQFYAKMPQGESAYDVAIRTKYFLEMIYKSNKENVFIVSHGNAIRTIIMNYFNYSPEWYNTEPIMDNCSVILIDDKKQYIYGSIMKEAVLNDSN